MVLFCHSRSNKCSSSSSVMSCCRLAGFTVGIRDSWSFRFSASSLRKRDLQEVKNRRHFDQLLQLFNRFLEFTINKTHCWTGGEKFCLLWLFVALFSCIWLLGFLLTHSLNPGSDASASAVYREEEEEIKQWPRPVQTNQEAAAAWQAHTSSHL